MIIAFIADIHDRLDNLELVLAELAQTDAEALIFCGDLTNSNILGRLAGGWDKEIHLCLGNGDIEDDIKATIDRERLLRVYCHQLIGRLTFGKRHVAFTHKPKDAAVLLADDRLDVVAYGHTHEALAEKHSHIWLVNPGDIQGRFGRAPSYALYDTDTDLVTLHDILSD